MGDPWPHGRAAAAAVEISSSGFERMTIKTIRMRVAAAKASDGFRSVDPAPLFSAIGSKK